LVALLVPAIAFADRGHPLVHVRQTALTAPDGLGAGDLAAAYGIPVETDPGATVAVIEAYGYPQLEADLAMYRDAYGLPACTIASGCLAVVNQRGQTSPLPQPPPPASAAWTLETALDIDMASAGCPRCKLLVVEADSEDNDNLARANDTAAALGATTISNSWAGPENAAADAHYDHPGVATFAASGDLGEVAVASYPASAPTVIAVGGTLLWTTSVLLRGWVESAWSDSGSACSAINPRPAWQPQTSCATRHVPDLAAVADGPHGIAAVHFGQWVQLSGTSAASPLVAAIFALTPHGSSSAPFAYAHPELFFDVQLGTNGSSAVVGYDDATGLGTPNAAALGGAKLPIVTIDPPDGSVVNEGFRITAACTPTDGAEVAHVAISIDNRNLETYQRPPYTRVADAAHVASGRHWITAGCATSSSMVSTVTAVVQVCVRDGDCPNQPTTLADGGCSVGGAAPAWLLLVLRARRRSRARG
jgi:Subtilase family